MAIAAWLGVVLLPAAAPHPVHAAFERAPLDAWSAALGGVVAVSPDGVFGNAAPPSGGDVARGSALAGAVAIFELARPFGLPELSEAQAGWWRPGAWSVAFGGRRFGTDAYAEAEARVGLAHVFGPVAAGVAPRYLQVAGAGFATRRSVAVDVGLRVEPEPGFVIGAVAESVLGEVPGDPDDRGRRTALGAARAAGPLHVRVEAQRTEDSPLAMLFGVEWHAPGGIRVAAGARERPASVSAGLSLPFPRSRVTIAGTWVPPLGTTLRLGVRLGP